MHCWLYILRILILWTAGLGAAAQFSKFSLFLPELEQVYPMAGSTLGYLVSTISLLGALLGLMAGTLASRVRLRRLLLFGLILGAIVSAVQSIELSLVSMLASRVLESVSHLAIVVTAPTLIALNSSDRYRSIAMTLWGTFFGVSFALTGWFGLTLVDSQGISALFLLHGSSMCTIALLVVIAIPDNKIADNSNAGHTHSLSLSGILVKHKQAWTSPTIAAPAAGWLFYTITFVALLSVLPGMMASEERAFTAAILPIASIAASLTVGVLLLRRMSAVWVLCIGFVASIPFVVALPFFPSEPLVCIGLFAALGLVQGASFASIPQLNMTYEDQALANGTLAQAGNLGNLCGTPLLLFAVTAGGARALSTLVVVCYLLAIGAHIFMANKRHSAA